MERKYADIKDTTILTSRKLFRLRGIACSSDDANGYCPDMAALNAGPSAERRKLYLRQTSGIALILARGYLRENGHAAIVSTIRPSKISGQGKNAADP
jgi:hypothetical protein